MHLIFLWSITNNGFYITFQPLLPIFKILRKQLNFLLHIMKFTSVAMQQLFALDILYLLILESWLYMQLLKLLAF